MEEEWESGQERGEGGKYHYILQYPYMKFIKFAHLT